jgi:glycosyltransferase involved in cell wall biosynthesis
MLSVAAYPVLSRLWMEEGAAHKRTTQKSLEYVIMLGVPVTGGVIWFAQDIIRMLYGLPAFAPSIIVLQVLVAGLLLLYVNMIFGTTLMSSDKQKQLMVVSMIAIPLNVTLNLVLIPHYQSRFGNGGIGAALATGLTEFCIMIAVVSLLPKGILREFRFNVILKSFLAGIIMVGALWVMDLLILPILLQVLAAFILYSVVLYATNVIEPFEIQQLQSAFAFLETKAFSKIARKRTDVARNLLDTKLKEERPVNIREEGPIKTLFLVTAGHGNPDRKELERLENTDQYPRASFFNKALNTHILDETTLRNVSGWRYFLLKALPSAISKSVGAFLVKGNYDAVISWGERIGIPFALVLKLTRSKTPHISLFSWISSGKKGVALRAVHSHIDRVILMSSVQQNYAVTTIGIPETKISLLRWSVDTEFWRPMDSEVDMICSVGREMRDYGTLIKAIRDSNILCHIAANMVPGKKDKWIKAVEELRPLPPHITLGEKSFVELRALYARSRFLVMPLLPTDTDNGATSILEAMAMGKPVICSKAEGQIDIIQDGRTGFFVPVGDENAMRERIEYLWYHPDIAIQMGREARKFVVENHTLSQFVEQVKAIVSEVVANHSQESLKLRQASAS